MPADTLHEALRFLQQFPHLATDASFLGLLQSVVDSLPTHCNVELVRFLHVCAGAAPPGSRHASPVRAWAARLLRTAATNPSRFPSAREALEHLCCVVGPDASRAAVVAALGRVNIASGVWEAVPTLVARPDFCATSVGQHHVVACWRDGAAAVFDAREPEPVWRATQPQPCPAAQVATPAFDLASTGTAAVLDMPVGGDATLHALDAATGVWTPRATFSGRVAVRAAAAASTHNAVYVSGGVSCATGCVMNTFMRIDPRQSPHAWSTLPPLPRPRASHASAPDAARQRIFVLGGAATRGGSGTNTVFCFDARAARWCYDAPLPPSLPCRVADVPAATTDAGPAMFMPPCNTPVRMVVVAGVQHAFWEHCAEPPPSAFMSPCHPPAPVFAAERLWALHPTAPSALPPHAMHALWKA